MRLDLAGDSWMERAGLWSGQVPGPVVYATFGIGYSKAIVSGVRLGVFEALQGGPLDADGLAAAIACSPAGTRALANALVGFGLLRRQKGLYENGPAVDKWLLQGAKRSLVKVVEFIGYCHAMLDDLDEQVRTGEVARLHDKDHPPAFWDAYLGGLAAFAKVVGPEIARRAKIDPRARRIVDVGGGHGLLGAQIARRVGAQSEVLDLPPACAAGRAIADQEGFDDVVRFRPGDFRRDPIGSDVDAVLIFNVLHNATADEGRKLLRDAFAALRPGGQLVICDAVHRGDDDALDASAGYNELFFFLVSGAQAWPEPVMRGWAEDAGFVALSAARLMMLPSVLIRARKPA